MSSSLESLAVKSSRVSSHSAKFESSRESPKKVTRVRLESLPVTRVNNSAAWCLILGAMYYILLLCNCVICINCHLGLSCVNNVFCYSLPGIGGQSYVDTANNNNNKLCPSLAKFNFIHVFVFDVRNMHK